MGYAMEDMFVELNAADWQARDYETQKKRTLSRRLQLRAQVKELIDVYSLQHQLGAVQDGLLMDALCLAVKQLLGLSGCWLFNGSIVMGTSQTRGGHIALPGMLTVEAGAYAGNHAIWKALNLTGTEPGYAAPCPLFRQTGGWLLVRYAKPVPHHVVDGFGQVVSASVRLQHQLWQMADNLDRASESELQQCRTELTEWILTLVECQQALVNQLSHYISQRHGLDSTHPLRVATLSRQMGEALEWPDDTIEAVSLAGFQAVLEGVQWKTSLQNGHKTWSEQEKAQAKAQENMGWAILGQFFPLVDWPAQDWQPTDEPALLVRLVREYCALTEARQYRQSNQNGKRHTAALQKLTDQHVWPNAWLNHLDQFALKG
jgi:HD-GYP domain-containing protein (c-di-GMP phosphodiesterase class II)